MSTVNSTTKGTRLTRADKKQIRGEVIEAAKKTGVRAYQFAWDGDAQVQITGFPNGKATQEPVVGPGYSVEPRQLLSSLGVPTRWLGVAGAALALAAEILRVVVS